LFESFKKSANRFAEIAMRSLRQNKEGSARFVAMTLSKVSTSHLAIGESGMMPALLTTTSISP
jgi:hypothetical protein